MATDINLSRYIFRTVPEKWHPYVKLARIDRPIGIWLLLLPCWWSIVLASRGVVNMDLTGLKTLVLFAIGAVLMRAAGCIINDLWDRDLDASVDRTKTRPLASGEISSSHALRFLLALLGASLLILLMLPHITVILGVISLLLVGAYPYMKRVTWLPQLFLGLTFNWGALMGWAAITHMINFECVLLYVSGIFWTLGYDTIYAHQDKEDDIRIGIRSTALLFQGNSKIFVGGCYGISLFFLFLAKYLSTFGMLTPLLTGLAGCQFLWQLITWNMNDPESCLKTFKSNQVYGLLALLMLAV